MYKNRGTEWISVVVLSIIFRSFRVKLICYCSSVDAAIRFALHFMRSDCRCEMSKYKRG